MSLSFLNMCLKVYVTIAAAPGFKNIVFIGLCILKIKEIVIKKIIRKIKQLIVYKSINWKKIHV